MSQRDAFTPPPDPVVEIATGRIRGFVDEGVHAFLGVPYGAPTGGSERFRAPRPPEPWAGVRPAIAWGPVAPQFPRNPWAMGETAAQEELFLFEYDEGRSGEDCLRLNVWTPEAGSPPLRPVMVWLHGGHFSAGSAQEQKAYHGAALARRGDVVVVSLNHRLNVLAFLNLTECGPEWGDSANAGMLDIVLALRWVRDNIAAFGGDPNCVTIFGQSGGGAKVTTLMAMPAAAGLYHRAIVQSNCALRQMDMETSLAITAGILGELGLSRADAARLQAVPYDVLGRAEQVVIARLCPPPNPARRNRRIRWEPVVDGRHLPRHAFEHDSPALSADVPLMVGTTLNEFVHGIGRPEVDAMTDEAVRDELVASFGQDGPAIDALMRDRYPHARPFDRLSRAYGATIRQSAVMQATRKAASARAPAFLYWFTWQTPVMGGRPRAFHCAELPFVFHNAARCPRLTGGGPEALDLADRVADAWIAFARTGSPDHPGLPAWPPFDPATVPTMMFDAPCEMLHDPDGGERALTGEA